MLSTPSGQFVGDDRTGAVMVVRRLVGENFSGYAGKYLIAFAFMVVTAATTATTAAIMKNIINDIFIARNQEMVYIIAIAIVAVYLIKAGSSYGQNVILARIGNRIVAHHQLKLFNHILHQGIDFFDQRRIGDLTARLSHNAQAVRTVLDLLIVSFGRDLLTLIGLLGVMVYQGGRLALIALIIAPPAIYGVTRLVKRVKKIARAEFLSFSKVIGLLQEVVGGIRSIKSFKLEAPISKKMAEAVSDVELRANKIARLRARTSPLMETLGGFAIAGIIVYGGYSVIHLGQDPGSFFAFITALLLAYEPAKRLARLHVTIEAGIEGVRLMYEILDTPLPDDDAPSAPSLTITKGLVRFNDVHFGYSARPSVNALNGLHLTADPGVMTALVGASGAGKSTVFSLLERFYQPQKGAITIDGQDIGQINLASLRANIALVSQDNFLFNSTIYDNIACGTPDPDYDRVIEAAIQAQAHDFITRLEDGYNTVISEGGKNFSGGQRQRIAIARAILRDASILLLDEATSAIDSKSEDMFQRALRQLIKGRTTIVIAHSLSTVRQAKMIYVIDNGQVAESGNHDQLIAAKGLYRQLYDLQFKH